MTGQKPLAGLTVLDMSQGIAGPSCGAYFAEFGARVVKLEPPAGDWIRGLGTRVDGTSSQAIVYNRGKESLALDLKSPEGRAVALDLAARADVLIESARPGVTERLGLGFAAVAARAPDIIYISVSGFGQTGPNRGEPLVDAMAQAKSGLMSITRSRDGAPVKIDGTVIDHITGMYAFQAATMALWGRKPGAGARHIDISLMQAAAHMQAPNILEYDFVGGPPGLLNPPAGNYPTRDGWIALTVVNEAQFQGLCRAIGRPELAADPRFSSVLARKANVGALRAALDAELQKQATADLVPAILREGGLASAINTYAEYLADAHNREVAAAPPFALSDGRGVRLPHNPAQPPFAAPVPRVGEHTRQVLAGIGYAPADVERLLAAGVVKG